MKNFLVSPLLILALMMFGFSSKVLAQSISNDESNIELDRPSPSTATPSEVRVESPHGNEPKVELDRPSLFDSQPQTELRYVVDGSQSFSGEGQPRDREDAGGAGSR